MAGGQKIVRSFRDLIAWQLAYALGLGVIRATRAFPPEERFGLALQLRRSAVSVASNIAEGYGRSSRTDYVRCLYIARGSLYELDTQLSFAAELQYISKEQADPLLNSVEECGRVLNGLIRALSSNRTPNT
jgi:four helix bundle protein